MRFLKWWLILAVLCLAGLLGFSGEMRRVVRMEVRGLAGPMGNPSYLWQLKQWERSWTRASVGDARKDWRLVWGAAELTWPSVFKIGDSIGEFQRAVELNPESREVRCRLAMALAGRVRLERYEGAVFQGYPASKEAEKPKLPDPEKVAAALNALEEARRLDPDNGLLDYYSALVLFAAHRDEDGMAALRSAAAQPRWEDYRVEAGQAAGYLGRWAGWPRWRTQGNAASLLTSPRRSVRWFAAWARELEEQGKHGEAIERYGLVFSIGERIRENTRRVYEVFVAMMATSAAAGRAEMGRASKEEVQAVEYDAPWPSRSQVVEWEDTGRDVRSQLALERFCAYLSAHGASDLALRVRADVAASGISRQEMAERVRPGLDRKGAWHSRLAFAQQGQEFVVVCLVVVAVLGSLSWLGRRPRFRLRVGLFPIVFGLALAVPVGWWWSRAVAVAREIPRVMMQLAPSWWWAPVIALGPVALLLVACWVHAVVSRRRRACVRGRRWFMLHWLGNVNIASLWAIAILLTLFLLLFIPIAIYGARVEHYYQEVLAKGEIAVLLGR